MRCSAVEILSSSPRVFGWMAKEMAGSGNEMPRQDHRMGLVAERVARERVLELGHDADLAGPERLDGLLRLALQPAEMADALLGARAWC